MDPLMVDGLDPVGEFFVECIKAINLLTFDPQSRFEPFLYGLDHPFDFTFAPAMVRSCMQESDPQICTHDACMLVDKRAALIRIEFSRNPTAQERLLEGIVEGFGIGA